MFKKNKYIIYLCLTICFLHLDNEQNTNFSNKSE